MYPSGKIIFEQIIHQVIPIFDHHFRRFACQITPAMTNCLKSSPLPDVARGRTPFFLSSPSYLVLPGWSFLGTGCPSHLTPLSTERGLLPACPEALWVKEPIVDRITDSCQTITFPRTTYVVVNLEI